MERRVLFPWILGDLEIGISASMYYSDGIPPIIKEDRLSLIIDQMIFKGKELGNRVTIPINKQEIAEIMRIYNIEEALGLALEEERLDIYLQPIYCPKNDMFISAEALVRFTDEKIGTINPDEFISLAEKNGMIFQIGRQVMRKVCQFIDEKQVHKNTGLIRIGVNLSILEAVRSDLVASIENCHKGRNIPYGFIGFEITETNASLGGDLFTKNMLELVNKGFSFAMDDFGTGYANLDSIIGLPFQAVKLDGALISAGKKNEKMYIVLTEHIQMFKRMGLTVIVEGVETRDQVKLLKDLPVDLIQGYYYAKPMPMEAAVEFIREYNRGKDQNEPNN
jgi:EAL domain-containing protein (putative c-di-GMP-specific phosphodiesterase class I)